MAVKSFAGAAALCLLLSVTAAAQIRVPAAYFEGAVKEMPEKKPGRLVVGDGDELEFAWEKGSWKVPYAQIKTIYLSLSRHSVLGEAFGLYGAAVGAMKKRKLLLSLILAGEDGRQRRCVFFLPQAAPAEFFAAVEKKSGRKVVYESEEARRATEWTEEKTPETPPKKNP
jgi:hypothetical protein